MTKAPPQVVLTRSFQAGKAMLLNTGETVTSVVRKQMLLITQKQLTTHRAEVHYIRTVQHVSTGWKQRKSHITFNTMEMVVPEGVQQNQHIHMIQRKHLQQTGLREPGINGHAGIPILQAPEHLIPISSQLII